MKAVLISHRFNPGHLSHLEANLALLAEAGYDTEFRLNRNFSTLSNDQAYAVKYQLSECLKLSVDDLFIVWFPGIGALRDMLLLRMFTRATVVYIFHEPFSSLTSYWRAGFGILKTVKIALVSIVNSALVLCAHKIVLPSNAALATYRANYNTSRPHAQFPLMFDDEARTVPIRNHREFIAYIGTVAEDHAFDEFLKFACWLLESKKLIDYKLLIATRSVLSAATMARLKVFVDDGRMVVQQGRPMSNGEINSFYARSLVIWNGYRRSMQSGVLPKAYMLGTPVLITDANRSEFFVDGKTGVEISSAYDLNEMLAAVHIIISRFEEFSSCCREFFSKYFFYRSFAKSFIDFVTARNH